MYSVCWTTVERQYLPKSNAATQETDVMEYYQRRQQCHHLFLSVPSYHVLKKTRCKATRAQYRLLAIELPNWIKNLKKDLLSTQEFGDRHLEDKSIRQVAMMLGKSS